MPRHPDLYLDLLRRRFTQDPALTPAERRELELHLLICPQCNFDYAQLLLANTPRQVDSYLIQSQQDLTADLVTPYLRDLVQTQRAGRRLTDFQRMIWHFVCRDPQALGAYRLIEADWQLQRVQ
jgi:hypothetical protein